MLNRLDYSYNDEESIIHRINPAIKFVGLFVYILLCLLKYDNYLFIGILSFIFLILLLSNVNVLRYLKVIWKFKYIIIMMYFIMYHFEVEIDDINVIVFKFLFFILYIVMIFYTTSKEDIGKGLSKSLNIFNIVGFSLKKISLFFTNIINEVICFFDVLSEVLLNVEIKGEVYAHSNLIARFKVLKEWYKKIYKIHKSKMNIRKNDMKYRLSSVNMNYKYKYRNKLLVYDYLFIFVNIAFIIFYILKVR